jgi:predicted acetyltransferase
MRHIRQLSSEADFTDFAAIGANAYPGMKVVSDEDRQKLKQRLISIDEDPTVDFYGLFDGQRLLGGMRLHDFTMNMFGAKVKAGGVGFVAVDLARKKEAVAKELIAFFLRRCRDRGQHLALLYPFRPDFYRSMGFGYGTKMSQYRVRPASLPRGPSKAHVQLLGAHDAQLVADCYNRFGAIKHGLIERSLNDVQLTFGNPENKIVGYNKNGTIEGYVIFTFRQSRTDTFLRNDIVVRELVYEHPEALAELLTFLHTQADQIDYIFFNIQDDTFHHLLFDPRNGTDNTISNLYQESNTQGVGIMYRVVDTRELFAKLPDHSFGGQQCRLKIALRDSFLPENGSDVTVHFTNGRAALQDEGDYDVAIQLDVAEFSALLMGVISFKSLYCYNLAAISDPRYLDTVNRLFLAEEKPVCMTWF